MVEFESEHCIDCHRELVPGRVAAALCCGHVAHVERLENQGEIQVTTNAHSVDSVCLSKGKPVAQMLHLGIS